MKRLQKWLTQLLAHSHSKASADPMIDNQKVPPRSIYRLIVIHIPSTASDGPPSLSPRCTRFPTEPWLYNLLKQHIQFWVTTQRELIAPFYINSRTEENGVSKGDERRAFKHLSDFGEPQAHLWQISIGKISILSAGFRRLSVFIEDRTSLPPYSSSGVVWTDNNQFLLALIGRASTNVENSLGNVSRGVARYL